MAPLGEALEYITQVLSARGPQAVPYPEATKWNIREHLSELLKVPRPAAAIGLASSRSAPPWLTAATAPRTGLPDSVDQVQRVPRQ
jgi:hypothetical protein